MSTPLTDGINALTAYANEVTGANDITLSDAVESLVTGYGQESSSSSSWIKVAETSYQVSTTTTSAVVVDTWETGHSEIFTSDKVLYVRIRDTAGKRVGYFYGTDNFFINNQMMNDSPASLFQQGTRQALCVNSDGNYETYGSSTTLGYGVFADIIYSDGSIRIQRRYNSSYSLTIDGTYKVEVYLLNPAGGVPIFE